MIHPLIGITTYNSRNQYKYPIAALMHRYIEAVTQAGGVPVLIPTGLTGDIQEELIKQVGGVLFTGGGDIEPDRFGGMPSSRINSVDPSRDDLELSLAGKVISSGIPFLGICRGFQVIQISMSGNLYTDISEQMPGAIKHDYDSGTERELLAHPVKIMPGTRLAEICGKNEIRVNSLHHQGAKNVPAGLTPTAYAPDGLLEGIELNNHPFGLAVQWHPEWLTEHAHARRLFKAFVEACA